MNRSCIRAPLQLCPSPHSGDEGYAATLTYFRLATAYSMVNSRWFADRFRTPQPIKYHTDAEPRVSPWSHDGAASICSRISGSARTESARQPKHLGTNLWTAPQIRTPFLSHDCFPVSLEVSGGNPSFSRSRFLRVLVTRGSSDKRAYLPLRVTIAHHHLTTVMISGLRRGREWA